MNTRPLLFPHILLKPLKNVFESQNPQKFKAETLTSSQIEKSALKRCTTTTFRMYSDPKWQIATMQNPIPFAPTHYTAKAATEALFRADFTRQFTSWRRQVLQPRQEAALTACAAVRNQLIKTSGLFKASKPLCSPQPAALPCLFWGRRSVCCSWAPGALQPTLHWNSRSRAGRRTRPARCPLIPSLRLKTHPRPHISSARGKTPQQGNT